MVEESSYSPYMVNRALSYFPDTIFYAAEMNRLWELDNRLQYDFLREAVRRRKRFSKWFKPEKVDDLEILKRYYNFSNDKARAALAALTDEEIKTIRDKIKIGGRG